MAPAANWPPVRADLAATAVVFQLDHYQDAYCNACLGMVSMVDDIWREPAALEYTASRGRIPGGGAFKSWIQTCPD